jgi:hypothetical protein
MPKRSRSGAVSRPARVVAPIRARGRALADHDVDLEIFHRRVQHFLHHRRQAMDLVDKQDVMRLQVGQQRGQVAGALKHRARGLAQVDAKLVGDHVRERGLAQARRSEDQHMVHRLAALPRRFDGDPQLLAHRLLAEVLVQALGSDAGLGDLVFASRTRGNDAGVFHGPALWQAKSRFTSPFCGF